MIKFFSFFKLTNRQKLWFFINFFLCGLARLMICLFDYHRLKPYFGEGYRMTPASTLLPKEQYRLVWQIAKSIQLAARYTPWNSSCLTQAMVAKLWCQYYRIPYFMFIGFAKTTEKPLGQEAHAWITAGPIAITGGHSLKTHQVIYSYTNINKIRTASLP